MYLFADGYLVQPSDSARLKQIRSLCQRGDCTSSAGDPKLRRCPTGTAPAPVGEAQTRIPALKSLGQYH